MSKDEMERLVQDLLELAKLEARRFSMDVRPVDVADDGPGIAPEHLPHVFDRLFSARQPGLRPDTNGPRSRAVGSGLGLAIVAELVSAMGGTVEAQSPIADGRGTRFVVSLPTA